MKVKYICAFISNFSPLKLMYVMSNVCLSLSEARSSLCTCVQYTYTPTLYSRRVFCSLLLVVLDSGFGFTISLWIFMHCVSLLLLFTRA